MSEAAKRRCRWPWVVLAAVLLLVAGSITWRFRPLNATESALVGHWLDPAANVQVEFRSDRRLLADGQDIAAWSASEKAISLRYPPAFGDNASLHWPKRLVLYFRMLVVPLPYEFEWDGSYRMIWNSTEFVRVSD